MVIGINKKALIDIYKDMKNTICEEYNCSFCDMCPLGDFWKDSKKHDTYNECQQQEIEYNQLFEYNDYSEFVRIRKKLREN